MNYPENRIYPTTSNAKSGYDLVVIKSETEKEVTPINRPLLVLDDGTWLKLGELNTKYDLHRDCCNVIGPRFKSAISLNGYYVLEPNSRNGVKNENSSSSSSSSYQRRIEELENILKGFENELREKDYEDNLSPEDYEIFKSLSNKVHQIKTLKSEISKLEDLKKSFEGLDDETKKSMTSLIDERISKSNEILKKLSK